MKKLSENQTWTLFLIVGLVMIVLGKRFEDNITVYLGIALAVVDAILLIGDKILYKK